MKKINLAKSYIMIKLKLNLKLKIKK